MPQNQINIPGAYNPGKYIRATNIPLEQEKYVPINTEVLLKLFNLGFTEEALMNFMGHETDKKDANKVFKDIMSRIEKGDAPGGLVGYNFPQTFINKEETSSGDIIGGEYIPALSRSIDNLRRNPPKIKSRLEREGNTYTQEILNMEEQDRWSSEIKNLISMQSSVPDTFNIYATGKIPDIQRDLMTYMGQNVPGSTEEQAIKLLSNDEGMSDRRREQLMQEFKRPLTALLHEPLHAYFRHTDEKNKGKTQEQFMQLTDSMIENILNEMSGEELAATIYKLLYNNGQGR
jgi:hypothetical protein|tara:strand:- start:34 stop:900 length:867 start_codon:yes stop_codon:yes gene_type:complete